jgi:hypothetical protein
MHGKLQVYGHDEEPHIMFFLTTNYICLKTNAKDNIILARHMIEEGTWLLRSSWITLFWVPILLKYSFVHDNSKMIVIFKKCYDEVCFFFIIINMSVRVSLSAP